MPPQPEYSLKVPLIEDFDRETCSDEEEVLELFFSDTDNEGSVEIELIEEEDDDDVDGQLGILYEDITLGLLSDEDTTLGLHADDEQEDEDDEVLGENAEYGDVLFEPPLFIQRYFYVLDVFEEKEKKFGKLKTVVDLGCSECKFIKYFRNCPGVEKVYGVDVDKEILERNAGSLKPLVADYLGERNEPFEIELFHGSIADIDSRLSQVDAVSAIELIEHLYPDELDIFPKTVFGFIQPKVAVITTPNKEHNQLLPNFTGPFRHWDHKFEWTRAEFEAWCHVVVEQYPDYEVKFSGVGFPGDTPPQEGFCSQIAVFDRLPNAEYRQWRGEEVFESVVHHVYPYSVDERSFEEKVFDEASYYIRTIAMNKMLNNLELDGEEVIPVDISILPEFTHIKKLTDNPDVIAEVLRSRGNTIEDGKVLYKVPPENNEEDESELDEVDLNYCEVFGSHQFDEEIGNVYDCPCFSRFELPEDDKDDVGGQQEGQDDLDEEVWV